MTDKLQPVFARNSTGLVRQLSAFDAFLFNQSLINAGLIITLSLLFVTAFYPGASLILASIVATVMALPTSFVHAFLAVSFPRSGGDYVYNSRLLHPAVGFAANWNISIWLLIYVGFGAYIFGQFGLAPAFRFLGVTFSAPTLLSAANWTVAPWGSFLVGTGVVALVTLGYVLQTTLVARVQRWLFYPAVLSLLAIILALFGDSESTFTSRFDAYVNGAFGIANGSTELLSRARFLGLGTDQTFSFVSTFVVFYFVANWFFWGNASTYLGGEVRHAERSQLVSLPAAVVVTGLFVAAAMAGYQACIPPELIGAIGYLVNVAPDQSAPIFYSELAAVASGSSVVGVLIVLGCLYWPLVFVLAPIGPVARNILAWSLDRIIPDRFCTLHPRTHTPVAAIFLCATIAEVGLAMFAFFPAFSAMVGVVGAFLTYILTSCSAAILPFRRKAGLPASPTRRTWFGIPVVTAVAVLSIVALIVTQISTLSDPHSGISLSPDVDAGRGKGTPFVMLIVNLAIATSGFVFYYAARIVQRRRGIDITLGSREIPPE